MNEKAMPPLNYADLLTDIKQRIRQAQTRAMLSVNAELIRLYWKLGQMLDARQKIEGWGAAVIPRLARDIRNDLPEIKGFSERNIKRMLAFYREYAGASFVPQAVALFPSDVLLALPWGHHLLLMEKLKDAETRHWYMQATLTHGWSRNVLQMQIETSAHAHQGKATSNFALRLPLPQSDLAQQALKDPYVFDFLTLAEPFRERELETVLIAHLEKFLLELGQGFSFVGRQYHVGVEDQDFILICCFITCTCAALSSSNSSAVRLSRNTRAR